MAAAMAGQNPLAVAADPFGGTFQNEQMKLELARKGAEYAGVILLGGQSLPVQAKAAAGKLAGTFESQGQSYAFQATRNGSQMILVTDGVTHTLEKAGGTPSTAPAPAVVGEWRSANGVVRVNADGTAAIGDKTHRWTVSGNTITFAGNGESIQVPFEMAGNVWTWKFPDGQLVLNRVGSGTEAAGLAGNWQGPTGSVQINLDGTATVAGVPYRYTRAGNQLTLAGPDGTFVAAVEQQGDSMTWVINGKTLQFQRAAATWAVGGSTGTGGILPELVGKWCDSTYMNNSSGTYGRSACFTLLADGSYQYAGDSSATGQAGGGAYGTAADGSDAGTWTATATTITANSRKTGTRTFRLEKRNNPKTGDPMLVLDGTAFTTAYQKAPWR
jgi:hypothetical protein